MSKSRGSSNNRRKARGHPASSLPPRPPLLHAVTGSETAATADSSLPDDSFQRTTKQLIRFGSEKQAGRRANGKWLLALLWLGVMLAILAALFVLLSGA